MTNAAQHTSEGTLWSGSGTRTVLPYVVTGIALVIAILVLGDEIGHHVRRLESWIGGLGPAAFLVFVVFYAALGSVFVPDTLLGIVAGASFGFTRGLMATATGSALAAVIQYALSRSLARPAIQRMVSARPPLAAIQAAVLRQELRLQILIRLTPLNRALTSYVLGAAGVSFARFLSACVALLPSLCVEAWFGYAGRHVAKMTSRVGHPVFFHDVALVVGLAMAGVVMVIVSREARRAVHAAVSESGATR